MNNYVRLSLETHLFFSRIMKEHSLFLIAGFPCKNEDYIRKADWYRMQFEELLERVVELSDGVVGREVLQSGEVTTEYTEEAERCTSCLTGIPIDSSITEREKSICPAGDCQKERQDYRWGTGQGSYRNMRGHYPAQNYQRNGREQYSVQNRQTDREQRMNRKVRELNDKALELVKGLICFKEDVLRDMTECRIYTTNYPLLIRHIIREARLYQETVAELNEKGYICSKNLRAMEQFWNRIMMEHALFIRGLLDPSEEELIQTANGFAEDYRRLLKEARDKDLRTMDELTRRTIQETVRYRDFKAAGTKGITDCEIESLILPLLADHVLREANHYLRILHEGCKG